jgi:hypothetical protein
VRKKEGEGEGRGIREIGWGWRGCWMVRGSDGVREGKGE